MLRIKHILKHCYDYCGSVCSKFRGTIVHDDDKTGLLVGQTYTNQCSAQQCIVCSKEGNYVCFMGKCADCVRESEECTTCHAKGLHLFWKGNCETCYESSLCCKKCHTHGVKLILHGMCQMCCDQTAVFLIGRPTSSI